jgi:hypothetical protein
MERGFKARIRLGRDLSISGGLVLAGGILELASHGFSAVSVEMTGGRIDGGTGALNAGDVRVRAGTLETPGGLCRVRTLDIRPPGLVRVGKGGRLEIYGDDEPLTGGRFLDSRTNQPNSVELTGRAGQSVPSPSRKSRGPLSFGDPEKVLTLDPGETFVNASVIDAAAGFAYFAVPGTADYPSSIVRVRLSDNTRAGTLTLPVSDGEIGSAAIDTVGGLLYLGMKTTPGSVVKVRLSDFTRVDALLLAPGENDVSAAVLDPAGGFAYFGMNTSPGIIVKVRLSDFTRTTALSLDVGEGGISSAVLDSAGSFGYFTNYGGVAKIRLVDFSKVASAWISPYFIRVSAIDPGGSFGYFAGDASEAIKVRLSDLSIVGRLPFAAVRFISIDPAGTFAYFGQSAFPGAVVKVRLSDDSVAGTLALQEDESYLSTGVLDPGHSTLIVAGWSPPAKLVRIDLVTFTRVDALRLRSGEDYGSCSVIDAAAGFAYFATYTEPGIVVKVRLSDFTRLGALTLAPGENGLTSAVIDPAGGFAYLGTYTDPGIVVKVRLSDFTRVGTLSLQPGESYLTAASIDAGAGFAYFGTAAYYLPEGSPGLLTKVRLSDMTRIASIDVAGPGSTVYCSAVDPAAGYLYAGTPAGVSRIRLSDFSMAGSLGGFPVPLSAGLDPVGGYAYFGTGSAFQGTAFRVRLSDFTMGSSLVLPGSPGRARVTLVDPANGRAYFGTSGQLFLAGSMFKTFRVRLTDFTSEGALTMVVPDRSGFSAGSGVLDASAQLAYFGMDTAPARVVRVDVRATALPTASVSGGGSFCTGASATVKAHLSGEPPWSITWSDGVVQSGLTASPATRTVTVSADTTFAVASVADANGTGTASGSAVLIALPVPAPPVITAPSSAFPGARGLIASVPFHAGAGYLWGSTFGAITSNFFSNVVTFTQGSDAVTLDAQESSAFCSSPWARVVIPLANATPPLNFNTLAPCRIFDTRVGTGPGAAAPALAPNAGRTFETSGLCGIPPTATALSVNVTVTQPAAPGSLTLYAGNEPAPAPATAISFATGQTRAANTIVRLGSDGSGTLGVQNNSSGTVHFILDVNGYFE